MAPPIEAPKLAELRPAIDYGMRKVQRHITTLDADGKSVLAPSEDVLYCDRGGYAVSWTYATTEVPAVLAGNKDLDGYVTWDPASKNSVVHTGSRIVNGGGVTFNTTNFAPGTETVMHRTVSLDFVTVVEGDIELELDSGEKVLLKPGVSVFPVPVSHTDGNKSAVNFNISSQDSVVQRQTNHVWRNPSKDKPARLISMITPAESVTVNGKELTTEGFSVNSMGKSST